MKIFQQQWKKMHREPMQRKKEEKKTKETKEEGKEWKKSERKEGEGGKGKEEGTHWDMAPENTGLFQEVIQACLALVGKVISKGVNLGKRSEKKNVTIYHSFQDWISYSPLPTKFVPLLTTTLGFFLFSADVSWF